MSVREINFKKMIYWQGNLLSYLAGQDVCTSSVGECGSARGPKDTFDGSLQGITPCEENSQDDRIGVQAESEVVLKCERNNNEGACDMLC